MLDSLYVANHCRIVDAPVSAREILDYSLTKNKLFSDLSRHLWLGILARSETDAHRET
jgi:hypothetical protein